MIHNDFTMLLTTSKLRENIYRLLDSVLRTGKPLEIKRGGRWLKIVALEPVKKLARLERHAVFNEDPDNFVHLDWTGEWKPKIK